TAANERECTRMHANGKAFAASYSRNPARNGATVVLVAFPELSSQRRLLVEQDEQVSSEDPRQTEEHNRNGLAVESEAEEDQQGADVHGIADVAVGSGRNELSGGVKRSRSALSAHDKQAAACDRENPASQHQRNSQRVCAARK